MIRLTLEHCYRVAKEKGGICLSTKYINNSTKMRWLCKTGHEWEATYGDIQQGHWCPFCARNTKLTMHDCCKLAKEKGGRFLSKKYINNSTKYKWQCKFGHQWEAIYANVLQGTWCPKCSYKLLSDKYRFTIKSCMKIAKKNGGKCLSKNYTNAHTKYKWKCSCGNIWTATYASVHRGTWCPKCSIIRRTEKKSLSIEHCHKLANRRGGNFLSTEYINSKTKYLWKCDKNHEWFASYNKIKLGTWCPKCFNKSEHKLRCILENILGEKSKKIRPDWLKNSTGHNLEIDIYFEKLKIAVEYQGEQHYYPVSFGGVNEKEARKNFVAQQKRDKLKRKMIKRAKNYVKHYIEFSYNNNITIESVMKILLDYKIEGVWDDIRKV